MVEHLLEFRAVEHGVLVALVEGDGTVWTGAGAELAEHAGAKVVLVLHEAFLLLAVGSFVELARHLDGIVGAGHLAQTATDALVLVLLVVGHREGTAKTVEHDGIKNRYCERRQIPLLRIPYTEQEIENKKQELENKKQEISKTLDKQMQELQRISGLSKEEAKNQLSLKHQDLV